jgi:predicted TIM-barrel enzyme
MEVEMISRAHNMGFLMTPYAFNPAEGAAMAKAGAHIIVAHMGLTTAGSIGAKTAATLDDSVVRVQAIADAALAVNPDIIVLCHGGTRSNFCRPQVTYAMSMLFFIMQNHVILIHDSIRSHIRAPGGGVCPEEH